MEILILISFFLSYYYVIFLRTYKKISHFERTETGGDAKIKGSGVAIRHSALFFVVLVLISIGMRVRSASDGATGGAPPRRQK